MKRLFIPIAALALFSAAGCKATKSYPDPLPGWHNTDFSVVYGRLQRIAPVKADDPPIWIIRFGLASERYGGEFALTPPEQLTGYSGGEQVEVRGSIRHGASNPDYPGTWYQVNHIRMWSNYR